MVKTSIGDQNPQFMKMANNLATLNTFIESEHPTPVIPTITGNKAMVMEILKAYFFIGDAMPDETTPLLNSSVQVQLCRDSQAAIAAWEDEDHLIPRHDRQFTNREVGVSANTHSELTFPSSQEYDYTDGNGNGIIFSGRTIYFGSDSGNLVNVIDTGCWLLYRLVKVDIKEFLGELLD